MFLERYELWKKIEIKDKINLTMKEASDFNLSR